MRMVFLAHKIAAASDGYTKESRQEAENAAMRIWLKLFGPQPPKEPPKARDFVK